MFTACFIMHRRSCLLAGNFFGALYHKLLTQSSAPEDGRNYRAKHVELIEIINNKIIIVASSWLFILYYVILGRAGNEEKYSYGNFSHRWAMVQFKCE